MKQKFEMEQKTAPWLERREEGLVLTDGEISLIGDFTKDLRRLRPENLNKELIVKAAKKGMVKEGSELPLAVDATAGLGEDSLLLAASGFRVKMFEYNPIIGELLMDALDRASRDERLAEIVGRMELIQGNSIEHLKDLRADIVLLDPMFPERQKSGMVKKKFQLLQKLENPAQDEEGLLNAAIEASPRKIIIKRPAKAPYLAGVKPSYSLQGSVIRIDCVVTG